MARPLSFVVSCLRWVAVLPGAILGAVAIRHLFYLVTVDYFAPTWFLPKLFFGVQLGFVFAAALAFVGSRIAPTHRGNNRFGTVCALGAPQRVPPRLRYSL